LVGAWAETDGAAIPMGSASAHASDKASSPFGTAS
jgi:hypothetical protein